jgi:hypothetical protein
MRKIYLKLMILAMVVSALGLSPAFAEMSVKISEPQNGTVISNPIKICLKTSGLTVEPASKGRGEKRGHHHLIIDAPLPVDLTKFIHKNSHSIHLGNGADCKSIHLEPGEHIIRALFGYADHIPYSPPLTDTVTFTVK